MSKYTVTRQLQWPDGDRVVEVSVGSFDYCNPGSLASNYKGENEEYELATEAVNAALSIQEQWQKDLPGEEIGIAYGNTGGMTMPFSPCDKEEVLKWAEQRDADLPCCDHCGKKITGRSWISVDYQDFEFCSEYCVVEWLYEQNKEEEDE